MAMRSKERREKSEAKAKRRRRRSLQEKDHNACMLQLTNDAWPCDDREPCHIVVNCGACIPPVAKHRKHGLLYSPSMIDTLGTSVGSSMLRLVLCCFRS